MELRTYLAVSSALFLVFATAACDSGGGSSNPGGTGDAGAEADTTDGTDTTAAPDEGGPDVAACTCDGIACGTNDCGEECGGCGGGETCSANQCISILDTVTCDRSEFVVFKPFAKKLPSGGTLYVGMSTLETPRDQFSLKIDPATGPIPTAAGQFDLAAVATDYPGIVTQIGASCAADGGAYTCAKDFVATAGLLDMKSLGAGTAPINGSITNGVFREATIDPATGAATIVDGGETWCVPTLAFAEGIKGNTVPNPNDFPLADTEVSPTCVTEGNGELIGNNIADIEFVNCDGDPVNLHDACGDDTATWIMGVAGWCTACTALLESLSNSFGGFIDPSTLPPEWRLIVVLYENQYGQEPTMTYCNQYAASHHLDPSLVVLDWSEPAAEIPLIQPRGSAIELNGMGKTWTYIDPYLTADGDGSVPMFTPWHAVLKSKNMEYVWSSYFNDGLLFYSALEFALK